MEADGWTRFDFTARDGLRLAGRQYGWEHRDGNAPVVCLAGLSRNAADFHGLAAHLANAGRHARKVLCLDYRGRGMSQYDRNWRNYNPITEAEDVVDALTALDLHRVHVVGTSRGGLIAMILAAMRPGILRSIVLNDIGPQIEGGGLIRIKNQLARQREPADMAAAAANLKQAGEHQFPRLSEKDWLAQAELIYEQKDGKLVRLCDKALTRTLGAINLDEPLPAMWPQFAGLNHLPVLLVRGENSDILSSETAQQMAEQHPLLERIDVGDQGHAPDLGTAGLPEAIGDFLERADRAR